MPAGAKKRFLLNSSYGWILTLASRYRNKEGFLVKNQMIFQRYEFKYRMTFRQYQAVLDAMAPHICILPTAALP